MNADNLLLQTMKKSLSEYGKAERAVLFGSRARGDNTERSDYDIAVYGDLSREEISGLTYAFAEELPTLHKIDLLFVNQIKNKELIAQIEKDGVEIYVKNQ